MLSVHNRAVRNCPWTVALWSRYLLAMERHGVEHRVIAGANVFMGRLLHFLSQVRNIGLGVRSLNSHSQGVTLGYWGFDNKGSKWEIILLIFLAS